MPLRNKYTIFNPPVPTSPGTFGVRSHGRLLSMFPGTLTWFGGSGKVENGVGAGKELYEHALEVFTPVIVQGDQQLWDYDNSRGLYGANAPPDGSVSRNYVGAPDLATVLHGSAGLPGDSYIPNVASAPNADPAQLPIPPTPSPNYNNISATNVAAYNFKTGVFSPKVSSDKTRLTLGSVLTKGKSPNSQ